MDLAKYRLAIQLYKIYNGNEMNRDWMDMNIQQNFNSRLKLFQINDYSNIRLGKNINDNQNDDTKSNCDSMNLLNYNIFS